MNTNDLKIALTLFYNERRYLSFARIHEHMRSFGKYAEVETLLLIQKLVRDGYVIEEEQELKKTSLRRLMDDTNKDWAHFITYDCISSNKVDMSAYTPRCKKTKKPKRSPGNSTWL